MDKCVQMWNYGALGQTARVCFGVLCANRKKEEVKRDFGDLRIRRSEERVVNTPLVFKRVFLGDPGEEGKEEVTRKERSRKKGQESPGERTDGEREENPRVLLGDADQESETRMSKSALRTGRRQAVE
ncbi:hypothetical protein TNCV_4895521 [Trichonephila clavipes]|nr:hypothetical protein TNCV_4895521 [Trichonephila clavipes]